MAAESGGPYDDDLPLALGAPARRALTQAGYRSLTQLANVTAAELMQLHGMGPVALTRLREALAARGLTLAGE